jgi:truncated hemoglobin YjbI
MNLFDKYGGQDFWYFLIKDFYKKIIVSPIIKDYFRGKDMSHIEEMLLGVIEVVLINYSHFDENAMQDYHKHLKIQEDEFDEWLSIFRQNLKDHSITDSDTLYIINTLTHYRPYIVQTSS